MKKLLIIALLIVGCATLIDHEENKSRSRRRTHLFESIPFPHKIIKFPNLSTEEIHKNSYFWLEMKFSNYDTNNFVERRMDNKIRIEYMGNFALEIPNKIKISELIIIIDINQKTIKIGMMRLRKPSPFSSGGKQGSVQQSINEDVMLNQEFEKEFELIQNYDDFIYNKLIE